MRSPDHLTMATEQIFPSLEVVFPEEAFRERGNSALKIIWDMLAESLTVRFGTEEL